MSLDGVVEAPQSWHFPYINDEMGQALAAQMTGTDAMLLGRHTYEEFAAYWSTQGDEVDYAAHNNGTRKYVASTTLTQDNLSWQNSQLLGNDVLAAVAELKLQEGKDLSVVGSPGLVRSLLQANLLDELRLLIHPIVVGSGKQLFPTGTQQQPLKLVESRTFSTGVLSLVYQPAGQ
jgi:dihydrofolate reductase